MSAPQFTEDDPVTITGRDHPWSGCDGLIARPYAGHPHFGWVVRLVRDDRFDGHEVCVSGADLAPRFSRAREGGAA